MQELSTINNFDLSLWFLFGFALPCFITHVLFYFVCSKIKAYQEHIHRPLFTNQTNYNIRHKHNLKTKHKFKSKGKTMNKPIKQDKPPPKKRLRIELAHAMFLLSITMTLCTIILWITGHRTQWWWVEYIALGSLILAYIFRYGVQHDSQNR